MNHGIDDLKQVYFYSLSDPFAPHYDRVDCARRNEGGLKWKWLSGGRMPL